MFRLLKLLMSLAALAGFVWFGANVPLGSRTLFGHLQAIGQTREAHDLVEGTKESARPLVEEAGRRLAHKSEQGSGSSSGDKATAGEHPAGSGDGPGRPGPSSPSPSTSSPSTQAPPERAPSEHVSEGDKQALRHVLGSAAARKPPHAVR